MKWRPPRSTRTDTPFPSTTLFRPGLQREAHEPLRGVHPPQRRGRRPARKGGRHHQRDPQRMSEWREVMLGDLCTRVTVGHVGKMADEYVPDGVPFLRSQNAKPFRIKIGRASCRERGVQYGKLTGGRV